MSRGLPREAEELIEGEPLMAHFATSHEDRPHVAPVWYRYESGTLSALITGRKLANVRRNPRVAASIEKSSGGSAEWMVTIRGTATVVEDEGATREALRAINPKYGADPDAWTGNTLVRVDVGSGTYRTYD
ncbi:pyridoxamine 5'-phosphate oxidase family protein [Halalkalicoccus subterraneus]|uniref:pyridoxamine 5'-phosphate oxidase family protein n=1 Tax=Halalkalicoccus subterraneus TaxID=2675002 RepID=UPI000EFACEB7|nr:pyridoxamine 5'-phosphate oxidase family protein [Halalkalicoccus subterraneus]